MKNDKRSQKKRRVPVHERATLTPEEFAAKFGRQKIWTYRQVYAGRIKAITGFGNLMIPRSELDRILDLAVFDAIGHTKHQGKVGQ
jgi:hypothetical protein